MQGLDCICFKIFVIMRILCLIILNDYAQENKSIVLCFYYLNVLL